MDYNDMQKKMNEGSNPQFGGKKPSKDKEEDAAPINPLNKNNRSSSLSPVQPSQGYRELSTIEELFDKSLEILKHTIWKFVVFTFLPGLAIIPVIIIFTISAYFFSQDNMTAVGIIIGLAGILGALMVIGVALISQSAMYLTVRDVAKNFRIKEIFKQAMDYALDYFLVHILGAIFVFFWSLLFVIPGIIAAVRYSMAPWAYFYEGHKGLAAINRSKELVNGYTGSVFGRYLIIYVVFIVLAYVPMIILGAVNAPEYMMLIWNVFTQVLSFAMAPLVIIVSCYIYWDLVRIKGPGKPADGKRHGWWLIFLPFIFAIIIGLVSIFAFFQFNIIRTGTNEARMISQVKQLQTAIELYNLDNNKFPDDLNDIQVYHHLTDEAIEYEYQNLGNDYSLCYTFFSKNNLPIAEKQCINSQTSPYYVK